jgi:hypothetical protein
VACGLNGNRWSGQQRSECSGAVGMQRQGRLWHVFRTTPRRAHSERLSAGGPGGAASGRFNSLVGRTVHHGRPGFNIQINFQLFK